VTAIHAESDNYIYTCDTDAKISFNGTFVTALPLGPQIIKLKTSGEVYLITRPTTYINNIIFGNMYLEQVGPMKIKNATTGAYSELVFKAEGWGGRSKHDVMGYIYECEEDCKKKKSPNSYYL
jgi:hypothetical protein